MSVYSKIFLVFALPAVLAFSPQPIAQTAYKQSIIELDLRDYESLNSEIKNSHGKCRKIRNDDKYLNCLADIMELVYGRRVQNDGALDKLVRTWLFKSTEGNRQKVLTIMVGRALERLSSPSLGINQKATAVEILKNFINHANPPRPEHREGLEKIHTSNPSVPSDVVQFRNNRLMLTTPALGASASAALAAKAPETAKSDEETDLKGGTDDFLF